MLAFVGAAVTGHAQWRRRLGGGRTEQPWRARRAAREAGPALRPAAPPLLEAAELERLRGGLRVQRQERHGRQGSGFVVVDVDAPAPLVWDCLTSFDAYAGMIPVVRKAEVKAKVCAGGGLSTAYVDYKVSKFGLNFSVVHRVDADAGVVRFDLDPSETGYVLKEASGFWRVEMDALDNNPGRCRVWLHVGLRASRLLPDFLVDYAAERALRRATSWLQPFMEELWKKRALQHAKNVCLELVAPSSSNRPMVAAF